MPDHLIHLRRAWTAHDADGHSLRLDLPTRTDHLRGISRLVRTFHGPPIDPPSESLLLRLSDVPGLSLVLLDGSALPLPGEDLRDIEFALATELAPRTMHRLELVLDPTRLDVSTAPDRPWGRVGLLIRPRGNSGA